MNSKISWNTQKRTMAFEIRRYNKTSDQEEWNQFVALSKQGTFLLNRLYMDYHSDFLFPSGANLRESSYYRQGFGKGCLRHLRSHQLLPAIRRFPKGSL